MKVQHNKCVGLFFFKHFMGSYKNVRFVFFKNTIVIKLLKKLFSSHKTTFQKEGTVKFFNYAKGFGFITLKNSDEEFFVHKANLKTKIKQGNKVLFDVEPSERGPVAVNVSKIVKDK